MIGRTLCGRYAILRHLGSGGFSDTYLAEDRQIPQMPNCVVKRLKPPKTDPAALATARRLFETEATILYELGRKHEQIPRLLAHFEEDQEFYLVQEFIEGEDLSHELFPGRRFTESQVMALLYDILEILQFVHHQNVIHRDIKPRNLIRRKEDGKIFLIDFGAVKLITTQIAYLLDRQETSASIAIGTPGYMPNEQQGGKPRFSSDIYAVGMIAIQALTGLTPTELQEDQQTGEILWRNQAQVRPKFAAILDKMVRTHFKDRYKSVTEVLHDLWAVQKPSKSQPMSQGNGSEGIRAQGNITQDHVFATALSSPRSSPPSAPRPLLSSVLSSIPQIRSVRGAIIGALVLLGLIGGAYWYWREQENPRSMAGLMVRPGNGPAEQRVRPVPVESLSLVNTLTVHTGAVFAVAISPDGNRFVSGSGDKTVKLWDMQTGELLHTFAGHTKEVVAVAFSPDGQQLVSGSRDNTLKVWDLTSKQLLRTLTGHRDWIRSVAISRDGQTLASGSKDNTVKLWDLPTGKLLHTLTGHSNEVESVAITPDQGMVLSGSEDETVKLWNLKTGQLLRTLPGSGEEVESIALSPDGNKLVSGGEDKTYIWDLASGQVLQSLTERAGIVRALTISSDGQTLIGSYEDNTIKLWDLDGTLLRTLAGHTDWVLATAISPDGQTLISGSRDKTLRIWRAR